MAELHVDGINYSSIATAVTAAGTGDIVYVHSGTYAEPKITFGAHSVSVLSYGDDTVSIEASSANDKCFYASSKNNLTIRGMNLLNSNKGHRYGVYLFYCDDALIEDCTIRLGGVSTTTPLYGVYANNGSDNLTINKCIFDGSYDACRWAVYCNAPSGTMKNSVVRNWDSSLGASNQYEIIKGSDLTVEHCSLYGNYIHGTAKYEIDAKYANYNIVHGNENTKKGIKVSADGEYNISYGHSTNFDGTFAGSITTDPLYTDPGNDDLSLQENSPAINSAKTSNEGKDIVGNERDSKYPDIGAYEFVDIGGGGIWTRELETEGRREFYRRGKIIDRFGNISSSYRRTVDQVPFSKAVKGPSNLRGRGTPYRVTK